MATFFSYLNRKFTIGLLAVLIFSLSFGTALAVTGTVASPPLPIAYPTGIPAGVAEFRVTDYPTEMNTNFIVHNTFSIASILSGLSPGAQQDEAKAGIMMTVVKRILREMTKSIVTWINSGFEGNPSFITDTDQFLLETADITIGDFIMNEPGLRWLCDPFKAQIQLALGLQYRPFAEKIKCSFSSITGNVTDAMNNFLNGDFIGGGGWDSWLQITTIPQNNQMGAMMIAQGELDARIEASTARATMEANWGSGFLSWKKCVDVAQPGEADFNGPVQPDVQAARDNFMGPVKPTQKCTIQTPGTAIVEQMGWSQSSVIRESELAQDLNEIMNALANQLLQKGMEMFTGGGLLEAGKKPYAQNNYYPFLTESEIQNMASSGISLTEDGSGFSSNDGSNTDEIEYNTTRVAPRDELRRTQAEEQRLAGENSASSTLNTIKSDALTNNINPKIATETSYITAQDNIWRLLDTTEKAFASSTCPSDIITTTTNQITGNYTGTKDLLWNKKDIGLATSTANNNISMLTNTANSINSATSEYYIASQVESVSRITTLNSTSTVADFSAEGNSYEQIKSWVIEQINNNQTPSCLIDTTGLSEWNIE